MKKPLWLDKKSDLAQRRKVKTLLRHLNLNTVCEQSLCPNISECFGANTATFMILGKNCTRNCRFCNISHKIPQSPDPSEPARIKEAVRVLGLKYAVITSPSRDDLADQGCGQFLKTVSAIKSLERLVGVELLIPDFLANFDLLSRVSLSGASVIGHNLETVPRFYPRVRAEANYERSLKVLSALKQANPKITTKSGLILGLGETELELITVFKDLRACGCDLLTLGQYLPPSKQHFPVEEYITPSKFAALKDLAIKIGLGAVVSSAYARSSYLADSLFLKRP